MAKVWVFTLPNLLRIHAVGSIDERDTLKKTLNLIGLNTNDFFITEFNTEDSQEAFMESVEKELKKQAMSKLNRAEKKILGLD